MLEKETLFREKAKKYLVCFNESCPLHAQCLRWEVGQYYVMVIILTYFPSEVSIMTMT